MKSPPYGLFFPYTDGRDIGHPARRQENIEDIDEFLNIGKFDLFYPFANNGTQLKPFAAITIHGIDIRNTFARDIVCHVIVATS